MAAIDRTEMQKKYRGLWVALDDETVVGSGRTLKDALAEAKNKGYSDPVMSRMPEEIIAYVG